MAAGFAEGLCSRDSYVVQEASTLRVIPVVRHLEAELAHQRPNLHPALHWQQIRVKESASADQNATDLGKECSQVGESVPRDRSRHEGRWAARRSSNR
jgi:hypothetical protein